MIENVCIATERQKKGKYYRRFCKAIVVENTVEGPILSVCGFGYQNKNRKIYKNIDLCEHHLKQLIKRKNFTGFKLLGV